MMALSALPPSFARQYCIVIIVIAIIGSTFIFLSKLPALRLGICSELATKLHDLQEAQSQDRGSLNSYLDHMMIQDTSRQIFPGYEYLLDLKESPGGGGNILKKRAKYDVPWMSLVKFANIVEGSRSQAAMLSGGLQAAIEVSKALQNIQDPDPELQSLKLFSNLVREWSGRLKSVESSARNTRLSNALDVLTGAIIDYPVGLSSMLSDDVRRRLGFLGDTQDVGESIARIFPQQGEPRSIDDTFLDTLIAALDGVYIALDNWLQAIDTAINDVRNTIIETNEGPNVLSTLGVLENNIRDKLKKFEDMRKTTASAIADLKAFRESFRNWVSDPKRSKVSRIQNYNVDDETRIEDVTLEDSPYLGPKDPAFDSSMGGKMIPANPSNRMMKTSAEEEEAKQEEESGPMLPPSNQLQDQRSDEDDDNLFADF